MSAPVVVFAVGNPSRGDDALGPELCGRLEKWLKNENLTEQVDLIEDFQLQIEHALDLQSRKLALFIDAGQHTKSPYEFGPTAPVDRIGHSTHALEPGSVLQVYKDTEGGEPPPAFTLCVAGLSFELGQPISLQAKANADAAFALICQLMQSPELTAWSALVVQDAA